MAIHALKKATGVFLLNQLVKFLQVFTAQYISDFIFGGNFAIILDGRSCLPLIVREDVSSCVVSLLVQS